MPEFWVIASIGHCATKWLATVLDDQPHITAYHELKQRTSGKPWHEALRYEQRYKAQSAAYRDYWQILDEAPTPVVCDANSWAPTMLGALHGYRTIDRLIYVVRHGVAQLHSLFNHSAVWRSADLDTYALSDYVEAISGESVDKRNRWERLCLLWRGAAEWPERTELEAEVVTFEQLTQSPVGLKQLLPAMTSAETLRWRRRDINRKVAGDRRPETLWTQWVPRQRETFRRICGDTMRRYGYQIPE